MRLRPRAEHDLVDRTRYYRAEAGDDIAHRFFDAAMAALDAIGQMPGAGSPVVGELADVPGLRYRRVAGFTCGWFYLVGEAEVDVVRLLAEAQDLGALFTGHPDDDAG